MCFLSITLYSALAVEFLPPLPYWSYINSLCSMLILLWLWLIRNFWIYGSSINLSLSLAVVRESFVAFIVSLFMNLSLNPVLFMTNTHTIKKTEEKHTISIYFQGILLPVIANKMMTRRIFATSGCKCNPTYNIDTPEALSFSSSRPHLVRCSNPPFPLHFHGHGYYTYNI